jgi:hypothetical protein
VHVWKVGISFPSSFALAPSTLMQRNVGAMITD